MTERGSFLVHLSRSAQRDFTSIMQWSLREFGEAAAVRYKTLIVQAMDDLAIDPERPGSKSRPDMMIEGARTYPLSFSRFRVDGVGVKEPRHFLLYRLTRPGTIEIARILHDSGDLARHLPASYKRT